MSAFADYAGYYNLLYRDKDYAAEGRHVVDLIRRHVPDAKRILDIGCGTGTHARELAGEGYHVQGVDLSSGMLARASEMRATLPRDLGSRLEFAQGDARSFRLGLKFDAVVSLFHVMSYQTSNEDLSNAFASARVHLEPGGAFIFDCWYGPAVLSDRPRVARKMFNEGSLELERVAEPVMDAERNVVQVNYTLNVKEDGREDKVIRELHEMRYLFTPEVASLLKANDLELVDSRVWMSDRTPDFDSWNVCYVARG